MTIEEIESFITESKKLCDEATPGPWYAHQTDDQYFQTVYSVTTRFTDPNTEENIAEDETIALTLAQAGYLDAGHKDKKWQQNAVFIAHARTALPQALRYLRDLIGQANDGLRPEAPK